MQDTTKIIISTILTILAIDVCAFLLWKLSGQVPEDWQHAGIITEIILNIIK